MKKLALVILGSVFVSCCVHADTISVPSGTTYQLDATTDYSSSTFDLSGGTLDLNGRTASAAGLTFSGTGTSTLTNSGDTATMTYAGDFKIDTTSSPYRNLSITGGRYNFKGGLIHLANDKGTNPLTFEMSGDDTYVSVSQSGSGYFANFSQPLTMNLRGGTLDLKNDKTEYFTVNDGSASLIVNVLGGTFQSAGNVWCYGGKIDISISDGTFSAKKLWMGGKSATGCKQPHTLTMTGGSLEVSSDFTVLYNAGTYNSCSVNLNGGAAKVVYLRSNTSSHATSSFKANGGTLKPSSSKAANNDNFFSGFQSAQLGEQGLTFDATYDITVAQDFTGLVDGANYGTIVKNGTGALTLTGALCENVRLVVNKGRLVLNGSVDPTTTVTAVGRTLEINVPTTLAALTLGDGTTNGNLILGADAELIVTGEVKGSLDYSECDFVVTKDDQGRTHIVRNSSPVTTLEIRLDEEGATSNATESLIFKQADTLAVTAALDATLNMSGLYKRGALTKDGAGAAVLTNPDNLLLGGVTCSAGRLAASPFSAFGLFGAVNPSLTLVNGTVEVQDDDPITYAGAFKINATNSTAAVIFKNNTDVTLRSVTHTQGAFIKRGAGRLTIDPQNREKEVVLSRSVGAGAGATISGLLTFDDANGTVPTKYYAGFNVAEGELCLANGAFKFNGTTAMIGMPLTSELAAPVKLTITNADVTITGVSSGYNSFYIGSGLTDAAFGQELSVSIIDSKIKRAKVGSSYLGSVSIGGYGNESSSSKERVYVGMTNSVCDTSIRLNTNKKGKTYLRARNTQVIGGITFNGYVEADFDNCLYASMSAEDEPQVRAAPDPGNQNVSSTSGSWTRFTGGSQVYVNSIGAAPSDTNPSAGYKNTLIFDNAIWFVGSSMRAGWNLEERYPITYYLKTVGDGVTISKASGTCVCSVRLEGDGGLTKTGEGTFFFDTRSKWKGNVETKCSKTFGTTTWSFTGPVDIQTGTLAVTNGAIAATMKPTVQIAEGATWQLLGDVALTNVTVSGRGTVEGGTLTNPTIKGLWTEDGKLKEGPVFTGTVAGKVTIDLGATEEEPLTYPFPKNVRVATCPNAGALSFRVTGLGDKGLRAEVKCVGNDVFCTVKKPGLMLILK